MALLVGVIRGEFAHESDELLLDVEELLSGGLVPGVSSTEPKGRSQLIHPPIGHHPGMGLGHAPVKE
jgi:hypothetical protein